MGGSQVSSSLLGSLRPAVNPCVARKAVLPAEASGEDWTTARDGAQECPLPASFGSARPRRPTGAPYHAGRASLRARRERHLRPRRMLVTSPRSSDRAVRERGRRATRAR